MGERQRLYVAYSWTANTRSGMGSTTLDFTCSNGHLTEFRFRYDQVEAFQKAVLKGVQADIPDATGVVLINWIWLDPSPLPAASPRLP